MPSYDRINLNGAVRVGGPDTQLSVLGAVRELNVCRVLVRCQ